MWVFVKIEFTAHKKTAERCFSPLSGDESAQPVESTNVLVHVVVVAVSVILLVLLRLLGDEGIAGEEQCGD